MFKRGKKCKHVGVWIGCSTAVVVYIKKKMNCK